MKAKKLLPIALLAAMTLVACGGSGSGGSEASSQTSETSETSQSSGQSQSESESRSESESQSESASESSSATVQYGATIKNKDAFDGIRVGDHVDLDIELQPEANVAMEIAKGNLIIEADKAGIVTITGAGVSAVGAGEVTVSVYYMDFDTAADQLTFTVEQKLTPKVKYGTVHEGTLEDPFDNADAVKVGHFIKDAGETTTSETDLYIKGTVASFYHAPGSRDDGAVSWFLEPETEGGEKFEIYKAYKDDGKGKQVNITDDDIWKGAVTTAHGPITFYNNQMETSYAWLDKVEGTKPEPPKTIDATVSEAIAVGTALTDGDSTYDYYNVTGYVVKKSGNNYFLADTQTVAEDTQDKALLELYNISSADEQAKLLKGAKVTVKMKIKNYHDQIENGNVPEITVVTEGEPWTINYIDVTVAGALDAAKKLEDGATSKEYYKVTGQVVEITTPYSEQYGNISFTMADAADGEQLTVFRAKVAAADAEKIVAGVAIEVAGNLQNYVKNEQHTYELVNGNVTKIGGEEEQAKTVAQALEIAKALADGATTEEEYDIEGLLIAVTTPYSDQYGNISFTIADSAEGETLTVFRAKVDAAEAPKLVAGVKVLVHGKLQNYVKNEAHTYEVVSGTVMNIEEQGGGGSQGEPNYGTLENPQTVAGLLADDGTICPQSNGSFSAQKVIVKGVLKEATYSASYGTYTGYLQDLEDATKTIKFTGVKLADTVAAQVAQHDVVILEHYLEYYNNGYSLYYQKDGSNYDYGDFLAVVAVGVSAITLEADEHVTVTGLAETYTNYETAEFTVVVEEGYDLLAVKVNGKDLNAVEGKYSFLVAGDAKVQVTAREAGAQQTERTVTLTPTELTAGGMTGEAGAQSFAADGLEIAISNGLVSTEARVYKNATISFSAVKITKIVFTCTANGTTKYGPGCFAALEGYTFEGSGKTGTWEGEATSVVFTAESNQVRATSIEITYVA